MKNLSDYTKAEISAIIAKLEEDCCMNGATLYCDIILFDRLFDANYDRIVYVNADDGTVDDVQKEAKNPMMTHRPKESKKSISTAAKRDLNSFTCMVVSDKRKTDQYFTLKSFMDVFNGSIYRFLYSNYLVIFGKTVASFKEMTVEDNTCIMLDTIVTCDDDETILEHFKGLDFFIKDEKSWTIALNAGSYITTRRNKLPEYEINVERNYNDDIPTDEVLEILSEKKPGLVLFYGEPGGGKTSFIKYLIKECDKDFIIMDPSVITSCSDSKLIDFLDEHKDSVIVLEDCEKLLVSRDTDGNATIGTLLNLTDGIIGDLMGVKFICTFNCSLSKIDEALLRKGRLLLKYEFGKLSEEKTKVIYPAAEGPMFLADIFNMEKNDFSEKKKKIIGFGE